MNGIWTIKAGLDDRMVQKVPRNYFIPFLKIVRTVLAGNEDSKRLESIYAKIIVTVVIVRICLILNKLKYYDPNGALPDRTTPAVFDIAVKSLPQNSAYAIFL
jgi:hypothetical protein